MKKIKNINIAMGTFGMLLAILMVQNCGVSKKAVSVSTIDSVYTNTEISGQDLVLSFEKGQAHNYPLMAVWLEDTAGKYLETVYVAESIGKGVFNFGQTDKGKWMPGEISRPAALPYWAHKRGQKSENGLFVPTSKNPMPDALTGATPTNDFILFSKLKSDEEEFFVLFEINQTWDWNEYWTNNKYPENEEYKTSCQPAVVYRAKINLSNGLNTAILEPIGHSHYAGENGDLYPDLSTITTALQIAKKITVSISK